MPCERMTLILREYRCRSLVSIAHPEPRPLILPCDRLSICDTLSSMLQRRTAIQVSMDLLAFQ